MELIIFIAIIWYIVKAVKKSNETQQNTAKRQQATYQMPKQSTRVDSAKVQIQREQIRQAAMQNIEKAKQRAQAKASEMYEQMNLSEYVPVQSDSTSRKVENEHFKQADMHRQQENKEAMQQVQKARAEARNTTILQRAVANADEDKVDVTLETMEAEHNHSERVSAAVHHHPEDIIPEDMLGTIEDLMVKGYDGNLCFERDFVGEGLDMISRFSYQ